MTAPYEFLLDVGRTSFVCVCVCVGWQPLGWQCGLLHCTRLPAGGYNWKASQESRTMSNQVHSTGSRTERDRSPAQRTPLTAILWVNASRFIPILLFKLNFKPSASKCFCQLEFRIGLPDKDFLIGCWQLVATPLNSERSPFQLTLPMDQMGRAHLIESEH